MHSIPTDFLICRNNINSCHPLPVLSYQWRPQQAASTIMHHLRAPGIPTRHHWTPAVSKHYQVPVGTGHQQQQAPPESRHACQVPGSGNSHHQVVDTGELVDSKNGCLHHRRDTSPHFMLLGLVVLAGHWWGSESVNLSFYIYRFAMIKICMHLICFLSHFLISV